MKDDLISTGKRAVEQATKLRDAAARQIPHGETVWYEQDDGKEHIAITDRRLVITNVGNWLGERSQSIPLGAITGISTNVSDGKVALLQIAVPGRAMGDLMLTGDDLSAVMKALVIALPSHGGHH